MRRRQADEACQGQACCVVIYLVIEVNKRKKHHNLYPYLFESNSGVKRHMSVS